MKINTLCVGCIFILFLPLIGYAQQHDIRTISVNQGLPHGEVHDMVQGSDGFMWIATNGGGLVRYDGHHFATYTDQQGLPSNAVHRIFEDSSENIWVAADPGGVVTFEEDSLVNPFPESLLSSVEVWDMEEIRPGELWFATYEGGIFIWDGQTFDRITKEQGLASNSVWDIYKSISEEIWIATESGVTVKTDSSTKTYTTEDGLSGNRVYSIVQDDAEHIWLATSNGISIWDGTRFKTITEINEISLDYVFDIKKASNGDFWIGTETKGIFIYDGQEFTHLNRKKGLSSNYIYRLYEDRNQNMWVGTNENGISLYRGDAFQLYNKKFGLASNAVLSVFIDSNQKVWIGTQEGLQSFDGDHFQTHPLPKNYENNYIREMAQLPDGDMLLVMPDNELMKYDGSNFSDFSTSNELASGLIYDVFVEGENRVWIGSDEGLYLVSADSMQTYSMQDGLAGNVIQHINKVDDQRYYISTTNGLSIFDGRNFYNITIEDGLNSNTIYYSVVGSQNDIWVGTSAGISRIEMTSGPESFTIENFGKKDGMNLVATHFLWFDDEGYLWQGTNGGLNRLDVPGFRDSGQMDLIHYKLKDEGPGMEFNARAVTEDQNENAWIGTMSGLLTLDVSRLEYPKRVPVPNITSILFNGKTVNWDQYSTDLTHKNGQPIYPSITFPNGEHTYSFSFSGINFLTPQNISYRFKMEGFEEDWMPLTSLNTATYTNLEPGDYTFKVQALQQGNINSNSDTVTASYSFSVDYPFWQNYWFIGAVIVALIGIIVGYIKVRVSILEKKRLHALVEEQTRDLQKALEEKEVLIKEIHHRVKNNLAVISGLLELQIDHANNIFVGKVLSESQRRVQSISMIHEKLYQNERLAEIDFEKYVREFVDVITYSFSNPDKEIQVNINIDDFKLGVDQGIPCGLILNEVVSNAFEHAFTDQDTGTIDIAITITDDQKIRLSVEDDGKGLPEEYEELDHESLGLTLVETLGQQLQGKVSWESNERGTTFMLEFEKETPSVDLPA